MKKMINSHRIVSVLKTILLYCIASSAALTNSMWTRVYDIPLTHVLLANAFSAFCLIVAIINFMIFGIKPKSKKTVIIIAVGLILLIAMFSIPSDNDVGYIVLFALPLLSGTIYFSTETHAEKFWRAYINIMVLLSMVSIIFFFLGSVFRIITPSRIVAYKWGGERTCYSFYDLYYEAYYGINSIVSFLARKNTGIYTEPPMYVFELCTAIAAEYSFSKQPRVIVLIILVITVLTCMATTGFMFLVIFFALILTTKKGNGKFHSYRLLLIPVVISIGMIILLDLFETKLTAGNSATIRLNHMVTAFNMWLEKPVFGYGFGNEALFESRALYKQGASVGLPLFLALSGLFSFSLYFFPFVSNLTLCIKKNKRHLVFLISNFVLFFMTSVNYTPIFCLFIAFLLAGEKTMINEVI